MMNIEGILGKNTVFEMTLHSMTECMFNERIHLRSHKTSH